MILEILYPYVNPVPYLIFLELLYLLIILKYHRVLGVPHVMYSVAEHTSLMIGYCENTHEKLKAQKLKAKTNLP